MAISTYAELQTAVADWSHRSLLQADDFITLAEQHINTALDSRVGEVDATLTATISSRYITLPTGYMRPVGLWMTTYNPRIEMKYFIPGDLNVSTTDGQPSQYTIDGGNIAFDCPNDAAYTFTLRYKKRYDIASTLTNDILTNYSGIYLYGALIHSCAFTKDESDRFESLYTALLDAFITAESKNTANATIISEMVTSDQQRILSGSY